MSNQKPAQSLDSVALDLITAAEAVATQYIQTSSVSFSSTQQVREGIEYAYILAGLRFSKDYTGGHDAIDVVFEAMKLKFGMSTEEFATSILGG